jgi:dolichyl-phosphate-mannose--protein O-mannosyl transferase
VKLTIPRPTTAACAAVLVAMLAAVNFLAHLDEPRGAIWDESYYLTATQRYEDGIAQFASHPPLGLMLIAAGDAFLQPNRDINTEPLAREKKVDGSALPAGYSFTGVRLASGLFAVIGAVLFFGLMYALTRSPLLALVFSNLYLFENAFITQFRAAQLDAFQTAFALASLLLFVRGIQRRGRNSPEIDFLLGLACGLAAMVKLNAIVLALLGVMLIGQRITAAWRHRSATSLALRAARDAATMSSGFALAVICVFTVHVTVSPHPMDPSSAAGKADGPFVTATYREYLTGLRPFSPGVVLEAARDYGRYMVADFEGTTRVDANGSGPLQWPLQHQTINYRWDSDGTYTSYVQLVGNPTSWLLALLAPAAAAALLLMHLKQPVESGDPTRRTLMLLFLIDYAAFMVVHLVLGTHRVLYLYHYFLGLLLAFCLIPLVLQEAVARWPSLGRRQTEALATMTALVLAGFIFYSPFSFHHRLTKGQCERRNLIQHVVECRT